ncbi:hypothetical protein CALCODRAFT_60580 [Calocera cornea HHB12733]|uniref:Uncharacterized protein n=1 Tax=Calocera cornea HHB12733 TaxID=1353952 RepID=A0A165DN71_9BASI|nr:hypothetical protein CALCODRAFT_60580 [Calocera cornea HHB12733]
MRCTHPPSTEQTVGVLPMRCTDTCTRPTGQPLPVPGSLACTIHPPAVLVLLYFLYDAPILLTGIRGSSTARTQPVHPPAGLSVSGREPHNKLITITITLILILIHLIIIVPPRQCTIRGGSLSSPPRALCRSALYDGAPGRAFAAPPRLPPLRPLPPPLSPSFLAPCTEFPIIRTVGRTASPPSLPPYPHPSRLGYIPTPDPRLALRIERRAPAGSSHPALRACAYACKLKDTANLAK